MKFNITYGAGPILSRINSRFSFYTEKNSEFLIKRTLESVPDTGSSKMLTREVGGREQLRAVKLADSEHGISGLKGC